MLLFLKKKKKRKTPGDNITFQLCTKNLEDMIYSSWDIWCDRLKLVIMGHFLLFYTPLKTWKKKKEFWNKNKKKLLEIITILHMCTKNHDIIWRYGAQQHNFLSYWVIFCPVTPLLTTKIKIWKKCNKELEILFFYTCVP